MTPPPLVSSTDLDRSRQRLGLFLRVDAGPSSDSQPCPFSIDDSAVQTNCKSFVTRCTELALYKMSLDEPLPAAADILHLAQCCP